jgi:hypothetical protein
MLDRNHLIERVQSFASYPQNWDGAGAGPPIPAAISDAEKFIQLLPDNIARPHVSLAADGEINIKWMVSAANFGVSLYGDSTYFYYGEVTAVEPALTFANDSTPCDEPLPDSVLQWLADTEGNH